MHLSASNVSISSQKRRCHHTDQTHHQTSMCHTSMASSGHGHTSDIFFANCRAHFSYLTTLINLPTLQDHPSQQRRHNALFLLWICFLRWPCQCLWVTIQFPFLRLTPTTLHRQSDIPSSHLLTRDRNLCHIQSSDNTSPCNHVIANPASKAHHLSVPMLPLPRQSVRHRVPLCVLNASRV